MKGITIKKHGKNQFIPTGKGGKRVSLSQIRNKHAPNGIFQHRNPRTQTVEKIKLDKIEKLNNGHHALVGRGSDDRHVVKIIS